jgi:hypothetical protein
MKGCILSGIERETTHFWRFFEKSSENHPPIVFKEISKTNNK